MTEKVTPDTTPMSIEQADYLLGAVVGMTQGLRLVPLDDLADHLNRRRREAGLRGTPHEAAVARAELAVAEAAYVLVQQVEMLFDGRRAAAAAEAAPEQAPAADVPLSQRPLDEDDVWTTGPRRPR